MATANMNLTEIVPGVTPGPQYATDIVNNFSTIDAHDHTTGKGVKIPTAGLSINDDLPFGGNGAVGLGKSQYNSLGATLSGSGNYRSVHVVSGELYYLDGSGNAVQITSSGSVAGSAGNITGLSSPASVTFSTNKYVFKDTATSFAIMESADIRLFEDSASSITNYVALKSPAALASTYTLTMPAALPSGSTKYLASSTAGACSFASALEIYNATGRSTGVTVAAGNVAMSGRASTGGASTTFFTLDLVAGGTAEATITTTGKPVWVGLAQWIGGNPSQVYISAALGTPAGLSGTVQILRDSTVIWEWEPNYIQSGATASLNMNWPASGIQTIDTPSAGTYTYTVKMKTTSSNYEIGIIDVEIVAFEL